MQPRASALERALCVLGSVCLFTLSWFLWREWYDWADSLDNKKFLGFIEGDWFAAAGLGVMLLSAVIGIALLWWAISARRPPFLRRS